MENLSVAQMIRLETLRLLLQRADRDTSNVDALLNDLGRISEAVIATDAALPPSPPDGG